MDIDQGRDYWCFDVHWKLIDDVIDFVKSDLMSFCLTDNTQGWKVDGKYGLIPTTKGLDRLALNMRHVWACESNQNLFVTMSASKSTDKFYSDSQNEKVISKKSYNQSVLANGSNAFNYLRGQIEEDTYWYLKNISLQNFHLSARLSLSGQSLAAKNNRLALNSPKWENQTIAEHYFSKSGVYLERRDNPYMFKCSKERCLLDFSVQKSTIINSITEESKVNKSVAVVNQSSNQQSPSTLFDVPSQLMRLLPLKYEQY
jgi:hypothetical protein